MQDASSPGLPEEHNELFTCTWRISFIDLFFCILTLFYEICQQFDFIVTFFRSFHNYWNKIIPFKTSCLCLHLFLCELNTLKADFFSHRAVHHRAISAGKFRLKWKNMNPPFFHTLLWRNTTKAWKCEWTEETNEYESPAFFASRSDWSIPAVTTVTT